MNLHHFPYFDPTKKSAKKIVILFSGILYISCAPLRKLQQPLLHMRPSTQYLEFGFWALLGRIVEKIKNSKNKIIL